MKKLMLALLFVGSSAWAHTSSVLGTWQGQLEYTDSERTVTACTAMLSFTVVEEKLIIHQILGGGCEWESTIELTLEGQEIWQDGVKIGEFIGENALQIKKFKLDDGEALFYLVINVDNEEGTHALYSDHTKYGEGYWDSVAGELTKLQD